MTTTVDRIWRNARLATLAANAGGGGLIEDGVIAAKNGRIVYAGARAIAPAMEAGAAGSTARID